MYLKFIAKIAGPIPPNHRQYAEENIHLVFQFRLLRKKVFDPHPEQKNLDC